jgi:hypothetical protein
VDEPTEPNNNGNVSEKDETAHWRLVPEILESLAQSENDITAGRTYGEADVRAYVADTAAARADEQSAWTDDLAADVRADPTAELVAVADALAGADEEVIDDWRAETDLWEAAELAAADADYASGNTVCGEDCRRGYGSS